MNRTGQYLAEQRRARRLTPQQLAAAIGYRNVAKGARRILDLERHNFAVEGLLDRIVHALGLDRDYVASLAAADRAAHLDAWERWASEPIEPQLRFRPMAAVWCRTPIAKGLSRDEAIAYASACAVTTGLTHVLVWSRKEEVWCYPDGSSRSELAEPGDVAGPYSIIAGERVVFDGHA